MAKAKCIRTCYHNGRLFEPGESYEIAPNEKLKNPNFVVENDTDKKAKVSDVKKSSDK